MSSHRTHPIPTVIPGILAKRKADFLTCLNNVDAVAPLVHIDIMDGTFVKQKTWASIKPIAALRTKTAFEIHLMVNDPLPVIIDWMKVKGFRRAIVHAESPVNLAEMVKECRARCIEIALAISPGTPLSKLTPHLKRIDAVQVMGGVPGKSGQPLDRATLKTVRALRKKAPQLPIAFDIGVNRDTIADIVRAGVTRAVSTSAIANAKNPKDAYMELTRLARRATFEST